jgi:micrococcal nuclease
VRGVVLLLLVGFCSATPVVGHALDLSGDVPTIEATVTRAIDGTSLDAHVDGRRTALGYLGVEAPALNQPCGREARDRNRELAGAHVRLIEDSTYLFDEAGRRLYYGFTADGQSIDEILVREGLARAVRVDASRGPDLMALQAEAETARRGCLWDGTSGAG